MKKLVAPEEDSQGAKGQGSEETYLALYTFSVAWIFKLWVCKIFKLWVCKIFKRLNIVWVQQEPSISPKT